MKILHIFVLELIKHRKFLRITILSQIHNPDFAVAQYISTSKKQRES